MAPFGAKKVRQYSHHAEKPENPEDLFSTYLYRLKSWTTLEGKDSRSDKSDPELGVGIDGNIDSSHDVDPREQLYCRMVGDEAPDCVLAECWSWYLSFLESHIKNAWNSVLVLTVADLSPLATELDQVQLSRVYNVLVVLAEAIRTRSEVTLDDIAQDLAMGGLLREEITTQESCEDTKPKRLPKLESLNLIRHMIWSLAGPLTMLFDPEVDNPAHQELQLRTPASTRRARRRRRGIVLNSFSQDMDRANNQIHEVLSHFGPLLPEIRHVSLADPLPSLGGLGDERHVNLNYVCFDGLKNLANLRIEWVNTMNLHLQLDQQKKILRLYRFPAFCNLLYQDDKEGFLCRLYADHKHSQMQDEEEDVHLTFSDYLREILLTYRLLFGIDRRSRLAFKTEVRSWEVDLGQDPKAEADASRVFKMDPLLWLLCTDPGTSPELRNLLEVLDGEESSMSYALEDFPFFRRRLAELQHFAIWQKPNTWWKILFVDRRDMKNWWVNWTAWAVLLIGGGTIVLQFWQLVFQIWSTVISLRPPAPG